MSLVFGNINGFKLLGKLLSWGYIGFNVIRNLDVCVRSDANIRDVYDLNVTGNLWLSGVVWLNVIKNNWDVAKLELIRNFSEWSID